MSSTNVYYPRLYSSIYLPSEEKGAPDELVALFRTTPLCTMLSLLRQLGQPGEVSLLRQQHRQLLQQWDDNEIKSAINVVDGEDDRRANEFADDGTDRGENFRYQEYRVLSEPRRSHYLAIEGHAISKYQEFLRKYFQRICLVEKLRETRVLAGFSRIIPDFPDDPEYVKNLLWKEKPSPFWLPAAIVFGEGIFLELNLDYLNTWEQKTDVNSRINEIRSSAAKGLSRLRFNGEELTVRFFLLHTLAHALINRLIFECGYSSASLKERLYVSRNPTHPMAGLLIYTAAGDSEGTLGGLVRMGEPGVLEPVIAKALEKAQWCSTDPVCMESVQGPDACNLAACHACALVPETSCENFNRFLDRGMLIGWIESPNSGYFSRSDSLLDSKSAE